MDYLLQILKAVSNDRRLKILELLLDNGEMKIDEIARRLKIPLTTTCRSLKILERVYLVSSRTKNRYTRYKINKSNDKPYKNTILTLLRQRSRLS